jgi:hypothetical protein
MNNESSALLQLRPVMFNYKSEIDPSGARQPGLIAEEVEKIYPGLVVKDANGAPQTVMYHLLPTLLLNELQKQYAKIHAQQEDIETLKKQIIQTTATLNAVLLTLDRLQAK